MRLTSTIILSAALAMALGTSSAQASWPADLVNPFAGTQPGPGTFGAGHTFPGAAVPFGMVQWSPDTLPLDGHPGGYDYRDHHIGGFSLTHLSGAGCGLYGDFPFLPTTEPMEASPAESGGVLNGRLEPGFSHAREAAHPGYYAVRLNPSNGGAINVKLTATTRTGSALFGFPGNPHSSILINAGGSAEPNDFSNVQIEPNRQEISGAASSGFFCRQRPRYRVYFAAVFNRPFSAYGTWEGGTLKSGATEAEATQTPTYEPAASAETGAYATFNTDGAPIVGVRVGLSFVSVEDARANLAAEDPAGRSFASVAQAAQAQWDSVLSRISVSDAPRSILSTFYTALYHVFVAPRTFSDVNGNYIGMDGKVHQAIGRTQFADFSGWDVYRTEIQLLAMLAPTQASELVTSLLADAGESGCLPRWSYANGQSMTMVGDSADPTIAGAAAFGADEFDNHAALAAMEKGALQPCHSENGEYVERQGLDAYLTLGYIPYDMDSHTSNADSITGSPEAIWGSAATTLEYAIDDFSIAQFAARVLHDSTAYASFMPRSGAWNQLYNTTAGLIEPRFANGVFPEGYDPRSGEGFVEGDAYQYTWMVPQDPLSLFDAMGGPEHAANRLTRFLSGLNASVGATHTEHALLGNEPSLHVPWLYDWVLGRAYGTQLAVRRGLGLYSTAPDGYPGNDDLGTLSAWYVFSALGIYPEIPGVGVLAIGSPIFRHAAIAMPGRGTVVIKARAYTLVRPPARRHHRRPPPRRVGALPAAVPFIQSMRINGQPYRSAWITYCTLARGARIEFLLGPRPNRRWGTRSLPPSFAPTSPMPTSLCAP